MKTKTAFVFTVDVESMSGGQPSRDIWGELPGQDGSFGIERIMDLLEAGGARGTFFLNVYEIAKHGEESIARAARLIHSRGHDLELHTHPRPMYRFYGMSQAPLGEQEAILRKGISLLESWTGKKAIAHRAGAFSANINTLRAVEREGLLADCSLSAGSRVFVPLVHELGAANVMQKVEGVWEIPATCFNQVRVGSWSSKRVLDIEGCTLPEIKRVTRRAVRKGIPSVCILMHSFSLSRGGRPDRRVMHRLEALLAWLSRQKDIEVSTVEKISRSLVGKGLPHASEYIPVTGFWLTWCRALRCWNDGWKNLAVAVAGATCLLILTVVLVDLGRVVAKF